MIYKGIVSTVDSENKKARILITEFNYVTSELPVASYVTDIKANDNVLVAFVENNMMDGVIIENCSRSSSSVQDKNTYIYSQITPSVVWRVEHGLGKFPSVTVVDSAGSEVIGDVGYVSENSIEIKFTSAFAGTAYLN